MRAIRVLQTFVAILFLVTPLAAQVAPAMKPTVDTVPAGWTGQKFALSNAYPATLPTDTLPWKTINFRTQPAQYIEALRQYMIAGDIETRGQGLDAAKWFHVPGLLNRNSGREFIRGMTRERPSRIGELGSGQTLQVSNWAVGFYNSIGAYTIGKVWADPLRPDATKAKFEDGAMTFKLLFTTATDTQVPFLKNSFKWQGNVSLDGSNTRSPQNVLLLQVDVAVKDSRATETGWVFGTFMYVDGAPGTKPWDKLIPVGLMWGNDPTLTKAQFDTGKRPVQTWRNPSPLLNVTTPHGWLLRLNGPIDNPISSCLSCHARAVVEYNPQAIAPRNEAAADNPLNKFFTNTPPGAVYDGAPAGVVSVDYSLQLAMGISMFNDAPPLAPIPGPAASETRDLAVNRAKSLREDDIDFRGGHEEPALGPTEDKKPDTTQDKQAATVQPPKSEINWLLWSCVGIGAIVVVVFLWLVSRSKAKAT